MTIVHEGPSRFDVLLDTVEEGRAPAALYRARPAAPERTLIDILRETTRRHPGAYAIDDGTTVLSYRQLADEVETVRGKLAAAGIGCR